MKKIKILLLLSSNKFSGAENVACTIMSNLNNKYEMVYCSPNGIINEQLQKKNIPYIPMKKFSYNELKRVINEYKPDIIHANDYRASVLASFLYKKCHIISHIHGNNGKTSNRNIKSCLFNYLSKRFDKIIWVSDSCFDNYYYKKNVVNKSIVLYNVIDSAKVKEKSLEYKSEEEYDLIFLGRLTEQKNPERLIKVASLLSKIRKNFKMAIVGDGDKRPIVEDLIKSYGLKENVKILGFKDNPYPILLNSKILLLTSYWEGTPMVCLEAQALGKPIISTPVDGLLKIIKNDVNGYLSSDDNELVEKIDYYLKDNNYEKIHKNVMNNFKNINDEENYFKTICNIYKEVVNENE